MHKTVETSIMEWQKVEHLGLGWLASTGLGPAKLGFHQRCQSWKALGEHLGHVTLVIIQMGKQA